MQQFTYLNSLLQIALWWSAISFIAPTVAVCAEEPIDFAKEIAPILQQHSIHCHSPSMTKGDISLATIVDLAENEHVVPGDPDGSYLYRMAQGNLISHREWLAKTVA